MHLLCFQHVEVVQEVVGSLGVFVGAFVGGANPTYSIFVALGDIFVGGAHNRRRHSVFVTANANVTATNWNCSPPCPACADRLSSSDNNLCRRCAGILVYLETIDDALRCHNIFRSYFGVFSELL